MVETDTDKRFPGLRRTLIWLYEGLGRWPLVFRWSILVFDVATISYFLVSPFLPREGFFVWIDYAIGGGIALDLAARFYITPRKDRFFFRFMNLADLVVAVAMLAPLVAQNYAFLRIIRAVRIARAFSFLRRESPLARTLEMHHDLLDRAVNLLVFLFIMSALVYADQVSRSPDVNNYLDALYYTVTSLTTTGYGDVQIIGPWGRVLSILIMLLGVTLFLRLLKAVVVPSERVEYECQSCGLSRHDKDAVHCKHCGEVVFIPTKGLRDF